jgi:hypothetical protein
MPSRWAGPCRNPADYQDLNEWGAAVNEPEVRVTRYEVSCIPQENINALHFTATVEWRGHGRWAVLRLGECLGADGEWDYEPRTSAREDDWLDTHRFDLNTALQLAKEAAPKLTVNGWTVDDVLAEIARGEPS